MSYRPSPAHVVRSRVDVNLLQISDRACLRLLERARICTATQLGTLIYPSLRTGLRRTRKLCLDNLVTRESLPAERGGIPLAYRLSSSGRRRIHLNAYRSPGLMTTRHSLDGVEFVASLVHHDPGLVSLWWTEWLISDYDWGVNPDHLVIIDTGDASALILVEVDESTERPPVIRERLHAYAKLFEDRRVGWHLLWVVNSTERLARLRQIAGPMKLPTLAGRCWGVPIGEVSELGASAQVLAVGASQPPRPLRALATDPKVRGTDYPVGSPTWVRLLANGGREDIGGLWKGVDREPVETETGEHAVETIGEQGAMAIRSNQPAASEVDAGQTVADPLDVEAGLEILRPGELVRAILDSTSAPERIRRGVELLVQRENWYDLFDVFEVLCKSGDQGRRLDGVQLIRRVRPAANGWLRRQSRELLLELIDGQNERAVVDAVLAGLEEAASG